MSITGDIKKLLLSRLGAFSKMGHMYFFRENSKQKPVFLSFA